MLFAVWFCAVSDACREPWSQIQFLHAYMVLSIFIGTMSQVNDIVREKMEILQWIEMRLPSYKRTPDTSCFLHPWETVDIDKEMSSRVPEHTDIKHVVATEVVLCFQRMAVQQTLSSLSLKDYRNAFKIYDSMFSLQFKREIYFMCKLT